ncbi:hypothetical protein DPX16_23825 [Anabarilius grahami]|uniref:Uncharacterized protein n=1 Tax=Anabarilius grahami TaxID=495550 RepID=A0A3N0XU68_ANAGA|nr:hypothetical protein DPX16_23825 [Anabarilius grahami]
MPLLDEAVAAHLCPPAAVGWKNKRALPSKPCQIKEANKTAFLDAPVSLSGLFGPAVEGFTERFTAAQKSSQAMRHFLPKRSSSSSAASRPKPAPTQHQSKPAPSAPQAAPPKGQRQRARPAKRSSLPAPETPGSLAQDSAGPNASGVFLI